jgi:hypothetical protein
MDRVISERDRFRVGERIEAHQANGHLDARGPLRLGSLKPYWQILPPPSCGRQAARCCSFCIWPALVGSASFSDVPQPSSERLIIGANIIKDVSHMIPLRHPTRHSVGSRIAPEGWPTVKSKA